MKNKEYIIALLQNSINNLIFDNDDLEYQNIENRYFSEVIDEINKNF